MISIDRGAFKRKNQIKDQDPVKITIVGDAGVVKSCHVNRLYGSHFKMKNFEVRSV